MKRLIIFLFIFPFIVFSQELPKKPLPDDLRTYNQTNLMKVDIGMTKKEVIETTGGFQNIQTWTNRIRGEMTMWLIKYQMINNPYSRDLSSDDQGNSIEVLWYYTDNSIGKGQDNDKIVQKDLTATVTMLLLL